MRSCFINYHITKDINFSCLVERQHKEIRIIKGSKILKQTNKFGQSGVAILQSIVIDVSRRLTTRGEQLSLSFYLPPPFCTSSTSFLSKNFPISSLTKKICSSQWLQLLHYVHSFVKNCKNVHLPQLLKVLYRT